MSASAGPALRLTCRLSSLQSSNLRLPAKLTLREKTLGFRDSRGSGLCAVVAGGVAVLSDGA